MPMMRLISDKHREHNVSEMRVGRTVCHLSRTPGVQQLIWSEHGKDSSRYKMQRVVWGQSREQCLHLAGICMQPAFLLQIACLSTCIGVNLSALIYSVNNLTSPFWSCCHTYDLRLLIRGRHYHGGNRCPENQGRRLPRLHCYPSTVQKSHCFMPENVRLESGNFALMPLLFLLMKISLDN